MSTHCFSPLLSCPPPVLDTAFLIATERCRGGSLSVLRRERMLIQYLRCHRSNPKAIMLIPSFPDIKFSVTACSSVNLNPSNLSIAVHIPWSVFPLCPSNSCPSSWGNFGVFLLASFFSLLLLHL